MQWKKTNVLVTGGASFIGSHLVDSLVEKGAKVRVVDNLSSGKLVNIKNHIKQGEVEFIKGDLTKGSDVKKALKKIKYVFHLAAVHGGRGYVETHQAACTINLLMDSLLIKGAVENRVNKFIFASSGCVYPNYLQRNPREYLYLKEEKVGPPYDPDNTYGWAKLSTELTLRAYAAEKRLKSVSCRYFTVYGERGLENHAVIGLIAKAFIGQDPFEIWGDGKQVRNWTYVSDIVKGTIKAAESIDDGSAVNLGTMERVRVIDAVKEIFSYCNISPNLKFQPDMPTGPLNRVCDNRRAKQILGWEPKFSFKEGLHRTIDWYFLNKKKSNVRKSLPRLLLERS